MKWILPVFYLSMKRDKGLLLKISMIWAKVTSHLILKSFVSSQNFSSIMNIAISLPKCTRIAMFRTCTNRHSSFMKWLALMISALQTPLRQSDLREVFLAKSLFYQSIWIHSNLNQEETFTSISKSLNSQLRILSPKKFTRHYL